ncbi:MAG: hypothetical protein EOO88_28635 [Pedobacter sp.]|nr:MAG: hypothetical protein EOO88_28635 [Pedobacter sp.]
MTDRVWFVLRQAQDDRMVGGICELDVSCKEEIAASFLLAMTEVVLMDGLSFDKLRMTDRLEGFANWMRLVNG